VPHATPGAPTNAGFTLLELLVVLTILGLIGALAVPLLGRRGGGAALTGASAEVRAGLRTARATAIGEGRAVLFRGDQGAFWIDRRRYPLDGAEAISVTTPGAARIAFYPTGASSGGRVVLRGSTARGEIAVDPITGRTDSAR